jgi:hypothetical protein
MPPLKPLRVEALTIEIEPYLYICADFAAVQKRRFVSRGGGQSAAV